MEIYFDDKLINEDYYTELSTNFTLFGDAFYLGSTASNIYNISIDKEAIATHPGTVLVKDNGTLIATLVVDKIEENDFEYKYTLTDKMVNLEFKYDASEIFQNESATLLEIAQDICNKAGIELATMDFRGFDKKISWYDNTRTAREYIGYIAELNGGYAQIGKDGKLYFIKQNTPSVKTISIDDCSDFKIGEKHVITRVVYEQGTLKYEDGDETGNTLYLNGDNVYITEQSEVEEILNEIKGFEFYSYSTSNCPIDYNIIPGQIVTFTDGINNYPTIVGYELTYYGDWYGGYNLDVATKKQEETQVTGTSEKIRNLAIKVDRESNKITQAITEIEDQNKKISQVTQTVDKINQEVGTITGENSIKNGEFTDELQNWMTSELGGSVKVKTQNSKNYANLTSMYGTTNISQIISGLFADMEYTLEFDIYDNNPYDVTVAGNAVFLVSVSQNVTEEEMETVYEQEIQVLQTEERKTIKFTLNRNSQDVSISFQLKANGYLDDTASVLISNVVLAGGNITEKLAKLNITTDGISSEVKKKVGEDEVISKINQSAEAVGINANKIELSANDVLNLLAGNMINLSGKQIKISSNNFTVDENGNLWANLATLNNANITGGKIDLSGGVGNPKVIVHLDTNANVKTQMDCSSFEVYSEQDTENPVASVGKASSGSNTFGIITLIGTGDDSETKIYNGDANFWKNGSQTYISGEKITTPVLTQTSKESKKKNIAKYNEKALNIVKDSDIYTYNFKGENDETKKHIGFVIGDEGGIYRTPEQVISNDREGIESYSMTSILWKAVQELTKELEILKGGSVNGK